jgi:phage-related protein
MADFTWVPDQGVGQDFEPQVDEAVFGDGYSQRAGRGINNIKETVQVAFTGRTRAEINAIDTFLRAANGVSTFNWTVQGSTQKKYTCESWSTNYNHDTDSSLSASFKRRYEA